MENNEPIRSDYNETYSKVKNVFGSDPEEILVNYGNLISKSHPVLDIGSGQGRNSCFLASSGFAVHAIDPSQIAIKQLESISRKEGLDIKCQCCGFKEFPKSAQCYSGVLVFGLIQILNKKGVDDLIQKISELCCRDALVFVTAFGVQDPSYQHYRQSWQETGSNLFTDGEGDYRYFLEANEILKLFREFEVIHHWEGLGKEHRHGDGPVEQHAMIEAVFRCGNR